MAEEQHCSACERLKQHNPNVIVNGITGKECKSLQDNKGLGGECDKDYKRNDCEDLNDLNDCFIGTLGDKLPAYDECDWKQFAKDLVTNLWNVLKALICAICGLWKKTDELSKSQFKLVACKEVGSGAFGGTSYSASYLQDQNGKRTLSNFQLRVQILSKDTFTIKKGEKLAIPFEGKGINDKKLPCMNVVENLAPAVWHNYKYDRPDRTPEIFPQNNCYIGTSGRGPGRENFPANIYIIALERDITFNGGIPYQTSVFWSEEPLF